MSPPFTGCMHFCYFINPIYLPQDKGLPPFSYVSTTVNTAHNPGTLTSSIEEWSQMCIPIYTLTLVIDVNVHYDSILFVDSVGLSRSTSLPHIPSVSTVVDASHYSGILTSRLPKWSKMCKVHTLRLESDVVVHHYSILFVDSEEFTRSTSFHTCRMCFPW